MKKHSNDFIINTWRSKADKIEFFDVKGLPVVFQDGNYIVYRQSEICYLHTFFGYAVMQLGKENREVLAMINGRRYLKKDARYYMAQRVKESCDKGRHLLHILKQSAIKTQQ